MSNNPHKAQGDQGEELVALYLHNQGFTVVQRNYRCFGGEIDLIAKTNQLLVFVEVKTRTKTYAHFDLSLVVTPSKQQKIIAAARHYMAMHGIEQITCRFDVALVEPDNLGGQKITYIPDAFQCREY